MCVCRNVLEQLCASRAYPIIGNRLVPRERFQVKRPKTPRNVAGIAGTAGTFSQPRPDPTRSRFG
jgi:hypothetical protein